MPANWFRHMLFRVLWGAGFALCLVLTNQGQVWAKDVRLALLVGHERGWRGDQKLRYTLRGDLKPMARAFRHLGFQVIQASNPSPTKLRRILKQTLRRAKAKNAPRITTFLFYYTGHAGRHYLHLGARGKRPFHYRELIRFLLKLPVKRRFALLDACFSGRFMTFLPKHKRSQLRRYPKGKRRSFLRKVLLQEINRSLSKKERFIRLKELQHWFYQDRGKGVKRRKKIVTRQLPILKRQREAGLQIIASSQGLSWERPDYGSSVFTFHWLRGLRGSADHNRDGKITMDELYQYVQTKVHLHAGQKTERFVLFRGSYVLAPHYGSRLRIGPQVTGKLKISVANFVWTYHKRKRAPVQLPVVHGKGLVEWRHKGQCWFQHIQLPKGRESRLTKKWRARSCQHLAMIRKGALVLPATSNAEVTNAFQPWAAQRARHTLAISAGLGMMGSSELQGMLWTAELHYRWRYFGVGLHVSQAFPPNKSFSLMRFLLQPELGYPWTLGPTTLFVGLRPHIGITTIPTTSANASQFSLGASLHASLSWWFSQRVGLRFGGLFGMDYTRLGDDTLSSVGLRWQLGLSGVFDLSARQ